MFHQSIPIKLLFLVIFLHCKIVQCNRVLELSDKFLDVYKNDERQWLVKFYAPWCYHCQKLEPTYMKVAQTLHNEDVNVFVARVDCMRFTAVASHFSVSGFPTILFVNSAKVVEYQGERVLDEITDFSRRMSGPAIRQIEKCSDIFEISHKVYFVQFGTHTWSNYSSTAESYQSNCWFYQAPFNCPEFENNGIYAVKASSVKKKSYVKFANNSESSLHEWVNHKRFPQYSKLTDGNIHFFLQTGKLMVIAVVEELEPVGKLASSKHEEFRELVEAIANTYSENSTYIFCWSSAVNTINSIAMRTIWPLPNLLVLDTQTFQYYTLDEEPFPQSILELLKDLTDDPSSRQAQGGSSIHHRIYRASYDGYNRISAMYRGNPVLTLLIFGLPMSFLSIIIYTSCFSDFLDASDDEDLDEGTIDAHVKND